MKDCIFVPKRGVTLAVLLETIHALLTKLWGVFTSFYANIHAILEL